MVYVLCEIALVVYIYALKVLVYIFVVVSIVDGLIEFFDLLDYY